MTNMRLLALLDYFLWVYVNFFLLGVEPALIEDFENKIFRFMNEVDFKLLEILDQIWRSQVNDKWSFVYF